MLRVEEGSRFFLNPRRSALQHYSFLFAEALTENLYSLETCSSPESLSLSTADPGAGSAATASPTLTTQSFGTLVSPAPRAKMDPSTSSSHSQPSWPSSRERSLITKSGKEIFSPTP